MIKRTFKSLSAILALTAGLLFTGCYSVFSGGTGGLIVDAESTSDPKSGIANVDIYAYTDCGARDYDFNRWQEGSVFEHYYDTVFERVLATGDTVRANGVTWDEADDITEEEGQLFNWTMTGSTLKQEHISTFNIVPKLYTITTLDDYELVYDDDYGGKHFFIKVE